MAPRLSIPVSANLDEFTRNMAQAASETTRAVNDVSTQFLGVNRIAARVASEIATRWGASAATVALRWTLVGATIIGTIKAISGVVSEARDQLRQMVEIADKAAAVKVSPEFFQAFIAGAKGSTEEIKTLEQALDRAFDALKPSIDLEKSTVLPDTLKRQWNEVEEAIRRALEVTQGTSQGPLQFLAAGDETGKIQAALVTMRDLLATGNQLEALNIGEKLFGTRFTDNIRTGKIAIDDLVRTIEEKLDRRGRGPDIFSNETVNQAKELDSRLEDAWRTIENNLKPSFVALSEIATGIKSIWVGIIELMARGSNLLPQFRFPRTAGGVPIGPSGETDFMLPPGEQQPLAERPQVVVRPAAPLPSFTTAGIRARIGETPAEPAGAGAAERTDFEAQVESINRHIAALEADTAAVGKNAAEHAVLRAELALLQAIEREGGDITNEQITKFAQLRAEMGTLQALQGAGIKLTEDQARAFEAVTKRLGEAGIAAQKARDGFKALNDAVQFGGQQLIEVFDALLDKTTDWQRTIDSLTKALQRAFLEAVLLGKGPLAGILGTTTDVTGGTGGLLGQLFGGARAIGGPVSKGKFYKVGESGTEYFAPNVDGQIVPQSAMMDSPQTMSGIPAGVRAMGGGGGFNVIIENHGADVQQGEQRQNASGGFDFRIAVRSIMQESFADSSMDSSMGRFGAFPRAVPR